MSEPAWVSISTIMALLLGPVLAVLVSSINDERRLKYNRRMDVFKNLMRTRRIRMSAEHVTAINMVEIEFYRESAVIAAWKEYRTFLNTGLSPNGNKVAWQAQSKKQEELLARLLHAMATLLQYTEIQQLDILDGGYAPQGWADIESQNQRLRLLLIDVFSGNKAIPVTKMVNPGPSSPYPPPPELTVKSSEPNNN